MGMFFRTNRQGWVAMEAFEALWKRVGHLESKVAELERPKPEFKPSRKAYHGPRCGVMRSDGGLCACHVVNAGDVCRYHAKGIRAAAIDRTNHAE